MQGSFIFALACLGVIGAMSYFSVLRLDGDAAWVEHTYQVLNQLDTLLTSVTDAQMGARRYVSGGEREYLDRYQQSAQDVHQALQRIETLTTDNSTQQRRLEDVETLAGQRLADLETTIQLRESQGAEAAQRVDPSRGRAIYDELHLAVDRMKSAEDSLLDERQLRSRKTAFAAKTVIISGALLALAVAFAALIAIRKDFAGRRRAEQALRGMNEQLEVRVRERTAELARSTEKLQDQLTRLSLLGQITRAIGERQDVNSIFQVVVRALEGHLLLDFCCICLYDTADNSLSVTSVGTRSTELATELMTPERARIDIDENGLPRSMEGQLVYEPDIAHLQNPFSRRLAYSGLRAVVASPLTSESKVFGVLVAARKEPRSFSSGECEFLRQLTEHVGLATQQAELYQALKRAYEDLKQTQQGMMQQERLLALGKMASGIAHDINNAISPISLYTESLLERDPSLSTNARNYLKIIQRAIDDVAQTVSRMREFYRPREPQQSLFPIDLNKLVSQVIDLTRARWTDMAQQRGVLIRLETDLAAALPTILGLENELRDALVNLIFNAVDAMPDGGRLTLRTRKIDPATSAPASASDGNVVQLEVADTGVGMDEETRRRCLEPFYTTKGERGTGLGLAMVYGTMQRHGAEIDIRSAVGQGTHILMNFAAASSSAAGDTSLVQAIRIVTSLRILLVDDDPLILKSLSDALESDGHLVSIADGGQAGIDTFLAAKAAGQPFQVVISDLGMPYVDGRKVASAVKQALPDTPVLLLTGWGRRMEAEGEIPPHVNKVLSKPPRLRDLREALAQSAAAAVTAQSRGH